MNKLNTSVLLSVALTSSLAWTDGHTTEPASCYSAAVPAPELSYQTIVVIDRTTAPEADVVDAFVQAVRQAASQPGQRFVVLSFSAMAVGEGLRKHEDRVVEAPITDPNVVEDLPIRPFKASQRCVKTAAQAWPAQAASGVRGVIEAVGDRSRFKRSEIVYTLSEVLQRFTAEGNMRTRVYVLSDGHEAGSVNVNMHGKDGQPRSIDAAVELKRLPTAMRSRKVGHAEVSVVWFGLMSEGEGRNRRYRDARDIEQLRAFWKALIENWGARPTQIDRLP